MSEGDALLFPLLPDSNAPWSWALSSAEIAVVSYEPDDDVKEKKLVTLNNEVIPFYLEKLEMIAKENSGHLALGKLTWADFYFAGIIDYLNYMTKTKLVEKYPSLQKTLDNVMNLDQIKAWVEKRPQTEV